MKIKLSRREFFKTTALAAGACALSARSWAEVPGANNDIRLAVIGCNGRGQNHIDAWLKLQGVRLTALCDVDRKVLDNGVQLCQKKGATVEGFTDIRKLLESKNVDAISIATPNHWHALAAIWGMQAGKDVYVEKPVSYDIWEGEQMVQASEQYKKIVQVGTQSRSSEGIREAVEWVKKGNIGKIKIARGICYKRRGSIGKTNGAQPVPESVDYDLWVGPAPFVPPHRARFHYDWHWFWDYGAGDLGNQGVHEMDVARWFLGVNKLPLSTVAVGGRFGYEDDAQTPNTLISYHYYSDAPLIMEVRGLPQKTDAKEMDKYKGAGVGVVIECEGGRILVPNYTSAKAYDKDGKELKTFEGSSSHYENFIKAVRSRKDTDLNAPIMEGHRSTALCHLGNISYRLAKDKTQDEIPEQLKADPGAVETYGRMSEHLAANGIKFATTPVKLGPVIRVNPANEKIIQNKGAVHLWRRVPRKGFTFKVA